ncbi:hypothetical protein [Spongorhabdus nitratireducens]
MALNTRNFDHQQAYNLDNVVIDATYSQVERAKVDLAEVREVVRFSYTKEKQVTVEKYNNISVVRDVQIMDMPDGLTAQGVLLCGERVSREVMNKESVAIIYPKAINKAGNFNQFTLKQA